jgi:hypothetical protein
VTVHSVLSCIFVVVIAMLVSPDYLSNVFYVLLSTALEGFNYYSQLCLKLYTRELPFRVKSICLGSTRTRRPFDREILR